MSPLANPNPLAQLHDIIAPSSADKWPPAPIYWILLLAILLLTAASLYLFKRIKKQHQQQQPLQQLQKLENDQANFIRLNQLIKGVTLSYFPRQQVASLHGEQWYDFLHIYAAAPLFESKSQFLTRLYNNNDAPCSADDFAQAKSWIKQLPKQIKKHQKKANRHV